MYICIFEDNHFGKFYPQVYFRPVYDLRSGVLSLREKIESFFPRTKIVLHVRPGLAEYVREENPGYATNIFPHDDCWFINGRVLADKNLVTFIRKHASRSTVFVHEQEAAAVYVSKEKIVQIADLVMNHSLDIEMFRGFPHEPFPGKMVHFPWELIDRSAEEIEKDFGIATVKNKQGRAIVRSGAHLINRKNIVLGGGTVIKPGAVLDAEKGPIVVGKNVTVMPNAVIEGPVFIGDGSIIKIGAKIYQGSSIGKQCKVGGEVEMSIIQSFSNKQHDGFLGHSYLGSWVNIGADTNTSDLKNTYGTIKVTVGGSLIDTGMQFLGLIIGDHSKTGINTMFDAGTVVGVSCNIYGSNTPPKFVPSFVWGGERSFSQYVLEKSVQVANKVMGRRNVMLSSAYEKVMTEIFMLTEKERHAHGIV